MKIHNTPIKDLIVLEPVVHGDDRGWFMESFKAQFFADNNLNYNFIQDNQAKSCRGVVRGLHYQKGEWAQAKLVRVLSGEIIDVAVDLRKDSPTFGRHYAVKLTAGNRLQLMIPRGFAHGYSVLSESAEVLYKCDNVYAPKHEGGILWCDSALGIDWGISADEAIISEKDKLNPPLVSASL